ncbi:MAG: hypothetical protein AAF958_07360 [Planctomycetota bacterium]
MSRRTILTAVLTVIMIAIWNARLFLDWNRGRAAIQPAWQSSSPVAMQTSSTEPELWREIKKTVVEEDPEIGFVPTFSQAVYAAHGNRVELPGVGFILSSGVQENEAGEEWITEFLLLPSHGGVAWCCGLTPIPNHEFSVLVECANVPSLPKKIDPKQTAFFVNVEGTLRLEKENSINSLYTLENVEIEFLEMKDVLPPNVLNLCLNQPMVPGNDKSLQ